MRGTELDLFPVKCRVYKNPQLKIDPDFHIKLIEAFKDVPTQMSNFPEGVYTSISNLHKSENPDIMELRQFFWDCIAEYRASQKLYCDRLEISSMWYNLAPASSGVGHPLHRHPMSYLSAVYYITPGAPTYFDDPVTPRTYDTLDVFNHDQMQSDWGINEKVEAEEGKLILFPSWLRHYSGRQLENFDRYTVSFNVLPCGKINVGPFDLPQATIDIV